jgi:hypothetical protein
MLGIVMADKLARNGTAAILCGPEPALPQLGSTAQMMTKSELILPLITGNQ